MATPEETAALQEKINRLIQEYLQYEQQIGTSQELRNKREQEYRDALAAAGDNQQKLNNLTDELNTELLKSRQYAQALGDDFNYVRTQLDDIVEDLGTSGDLGRNVLKNFRDIRNITSQIRDDRNLTNVMSLKELEKAREKLAVDKANLANEVNRGLEQVNLNNLRGEEKVQAEAIVDSLKRGKDISSEDLEFLRTKEGIFRGMSDQDKARLMSAIDFNNVTGETGDRFAIINAEIEKSIEREKTLNKTMGITGELIKGLGKIPGLSAVFKAEDIEAVKQELRESGEEGNRTLAMSKMLQKSFGNLKDALTDPATIFTFLVTKGIQFNSEVTNISKGLGVTETQATRIRNEFTSISANTMDTAINSERILTAQSELNKELSLGVQFSGDTLVNFVRLSEKIGLSAQQAAKLTLASASTGESATEFAGKSALAAAEQAKTLGITVNMKEIMADTADLTNEQLILFGRQPEAIGRTLAEVKKLGIELGDLNAISNKLLDFQGSIESELQAELLTGKQLNLERARAAALAGDQATLAKEIASQVGTISEFESMNVLQRQKLAEALGMNVDQLSGVLIRQEAINQGIADAKDLTDEQLTAAKQMADSQGISMAEAVVKIQEQRSAQDKFNDAVMKLQRLFGELLGGPVGELLDAIVDVASVIIGPVAAALNFILTPVKMFTTLLTKVPNILKVIAAGLIALNFTSISATVGGIVDKFKGLGESVKNFGKKIMDTFSGGGAGVKGFFDKIKAGFTGAQDQASGIVFDPRMAGGGRFRDTATGRMVSEEAANAAGVFKPGAVPTGAPNLAEGAGDVADIPAVADDGSMLKEKMKNIAEGLKAFASMEVVKGGLALLIASPGLFVLSKSADGLNKLAQVKGEEFRDAMEGIAGGIKEFGSGSVLLGSAGLLLASPGIIALGLTSGALSNIQGINAEAFKASTEGIASGIKEFASASVLGGALGMTLAAPGLLALAIASPGLALLGTTGPVIETGLRAVSRGIGAFGENMVNILKGALALTALSIPIAAAAAAFSLLGNVDPGTMLGFTISLGLLAGAAALLGNLLPQVLMGAIGLAAVGAAIIPAALAFSLLEGIDVGAMLGFVAAISLLGGAAALLGTIAPLMIAGALGIAAVGVAIVPAALAFSLLEGLDPSAMLGFATAIGILGATTALLGAMGPMVFMGALGLAALGAAVVPAALAFSLLEGIDPSALLGFATSLGILGAVAAGLGFIAPAVLLGAGALAILGLALIPVGKALEIAAPGLTAFSNVIKELEVSKLLGLAFTLPLLAGGLTLFAAALPGVLLASIGLGILAVALEPLANLAPKLENTSTALSSIAASVALLSTSLTGLDVSPLEDLNALDMGNVNVVANTAGTFEPTNANTTATIEPVNNVTTTNENTLEETNTEVFMANIEPLVTSTVETTIRALVPQMVAALKEGQGNVRVVNDNFASSGPGGDINTLRRLPSENFG
jgi:hypothetical protein